jgi:1-acyl-sn-glycerol-3-phosphate acyltransferase
VIGARLRLALLWLSQVARVVADWCLRLTTVLVLAAGARDAGWYLATVAFVAPFIALAPLNGCLSNSLPRRAVLVGASAFNLLVVVAFAVTAGPWLPCLAVVALGAALYSPARYAVLPAAAVDARLPLARVNGFVEMGGAAAIVAGVWLAIDLAPRNGDGLALTFGQPVVTAILCFNLVCLVTALAARFPSDVIRPEPLQQAVGGFFRDCGRIFRKGAARIPLLGLASFQAVVTAGTWPLIGPVLTTRADGFSVLLTVLLYVGSGAGLGCLAAGVQGNARRSPGLVPFGAAGLLAALLALLRSAGSDELPLAACFLLGFTGGLINVPLRAAYMAAVPADARGNGMAIMNTAIYVLTTSLSLLMLGLIKGHLLETAAGQLAFLAVLSAAGALVGWWWYFPQAAENIIECIMWPMYRIRAHGPGPGRIPLDGPLILIANHSSYLDPFWVFKVVPRQVRPMMTSAFYDKPGITWAMRHMIQAIRVPVATFRRDAPELKEAVEVLRDGGCVLIFPEAILRRREDRWLRRFGQGVWHILQDLPQTPVVVCWIEGGWGSWASYYNGKPFQNKRPDWWRHIDIAVEEPQVLPPEVLAEQWTTRHYLMRRCVECRRYLGLPVPELDDAKPDDDIERQKEGERGNQ